jgi:hypothetical protein
LLRSEARDALAVAEELGGLDGAAQLLELPKQIGALVQIRVNAFLEANRSFVSLSGFGSVPSGEPGIAGVRRQAHRTEPKLEIGCETAERGVGRLLRHERSMRLARRWRKGMNP